ncbi:MAG: LptF/LptG family permease [Planctomycetota bacterium]
MKTLDRYIVRQFLTNFVILLIVLMGLFLVVDLIVDLDEFLQAGERKAERNGGPAVWWTLVTVADFYGPVLCLVYVFFSGLVVVGAMAFTVNLLQRHRELTGMLAGGVSLYRVALPIVAVGALLSLATLPMQEYLLPEVASKLMRSKSELKREGVKDRPMRYVPDAAGNLWSARSFDPNLGLLRDVQVLERDDAGLLVRKIAATEAVWDEAESAWRLTQGVALEPGGGVGADESLVAVESVSTQLSPTALLARQATILPSVLSLRQLQDLASNPTIESSQQSLITRTVQGRFSLMVLNVLLLVLALPYFLKRVPGDALRSAIMASGLCLGAWGGGVLTLQASPQTLPPVVSAWLPVAVNLPLAAWMLTRIRT